MSLMKSVRMLVASLTLLAAAGSAHAFVIESSSTDASAPPGSFAYPTFTLFFAQAPAFTAPYDLIALNFDLNYDAAQLTFNPNLSSITYNGNTIVGINAVLGQLASDSGTECGGNPCSSEAAGQFSVAWNTLSFARLNTPVVMTAAFQVLPGATSDIIELVGTSARDGQLDLDTFSQGATVTAVPEPEGWLMMLAGVGLIATLGRRRLAGRSWAPPGNAA